MRVTINNIAATLETLINLNLELTLSWKEIGDAMASAGMKVTNWMQVRNVLQSYINAGYLKRTSNVHVEEYKVLKSI